MSGDKRINCKCRAYSLKSQWCDECKRDSELAPAAGSVRHPHDIRPGDRVTWIAVGSGQTIVSRFGVVTRLSGHMSRIRRDDGKRALIVTNNLQRINPPNTKVSNGGAE